MHTIVGAAGLINPSRSTVVARTGNGAVGKPVSAPKSLVFMYTSEASGLSLETLHVHARMLSNSSVSWSRKSCSSTASPFRINMVGVCKRWRIHWSSSLSAALDSALWRKLEMFVACSMAWKVSTHSSTAGSTARLIAAYNVTVISS
jgi:hypothetical protein